MAKQKSIGICKFYRPDVKWGFIICNREEIFLHHTKLKDKNYVPQKDDTLEFEVENTDKGKVAVNVTKAF